MDHTHHPGSGAGVTRTLAISDFAFTEFARAPREYLPWHDHREASLCVVTAGGYEEEMDGHVWDCQADAMVFKPPFEGHADRFGPQGTTCLLIEIAAPRVNDLAEFTDITARPSVRRSPRLASLGRQIHAEFSRPDAVSPLALEGLILEVLAVATRAEILEAGGGGPGWLRQVHQLLHDDPAGPLTLSAIAATVGIHPSHLARTFRARYRRSVGEYLRGLRIERATREVVETIRPLAEIAVRAGFFDQSHFARVFKHQTGWTPSEYRRMSGRRTSRTDPHRKS